MAQHQSRTGPLTFTITFSNEMVQGTNVPRPRFSVVHQIGLPIAIPETIIPSSQPTMVGPDQLNKFRGQRNDFSFAVIGVTSPDTVDNTYPSSPKLFVGQRNTPSLTSTINIPNILLEFTGQHLDRPRLFLAPRIPLPQSVPTNTAAPFSMEMSQGCLPPTARRPFNRRINDPIMDPRTVATVLPLIGPIIQLGIPTNDLDVSSMPILGSGFN